MMFGTSHSRALALFAIVFGWSLLLPHSVDAQWGGEDPESDEPAPAASAHMTATPIAGAARATGRIVIDGRPEEAAWSAATPITEFIQVEPDEGAPVSQPTEVRVLYDDNNLYIAAWMYDDGPVSTRLGRRNSAWPDTDAFIVFLDTYHDHRTAYRFTTNPSGVIRDEIVTGGGGGGGGQGPSGTGFGDTSWDPVWETASSITDEGWFVEMRIPFSQLRFNPGDTQMWGLQVERRIGRNMEHASWSFVPRLERASVARFGHLEGISDIGSAGRLELLPFLATRAEFRDIPQAAGVNFDNPFRSGSDFFAETGVDLKYRIGSNLTLDATINPDFGQVEMDPAEINLTAFETRLNERRPFFVEGADILRFGGGVGGPGPPGMGGPRAQLLYSRRIGQTPQGPVPSAAVYSDVPVATTILGAFKLTGRTASGWSGGLLQAYTARERATLVYPDGTRDRAVVEPASNYLVGRVRRDFDEGRTSVGTMVTSAYRNLPDDPTLVGRMHSSAVTGGVDFRHETEDRGWALAGDLFGTHVRGDAAAIHRTQRSSARYYHRPDASHLDLDPDATSLSGLGGSVELTSQEGTFGGGFSASFLTPGLEANDLGFQTLADRIQADVRFGYRNPTPGRHLRNRNIALAPGAMWNFAGENIGAGVNMFGSVQTLGYHNFNTRIGYSFETWDDRLTRGGPLTRSPASFFMGGGTNSDNRRRATVGLGGGFSTDAAGGWRWNLNTTFGFRPSETMFFRVRPSANRNHNVAQYIRAVSDPIASDTYEARYVFAPLDQTIVSVDLRADVTFSPTLTLEMNVEPFVGSGRFGTPKELAAPRTFDFNEYGTDVGTISYEDGRYTIDPDAGGPADTFQLNDPDFNLHSLIGSAVLRWEWQPGSTLYLVWQQVRSQRLTHFSPGAEEQMVGNFDLGGDLSDLFGLRAENILMVKVNYWLNP